jgi:hypothetical protein
MSDTKKCYIRRLNLRWEEGKPHHQSALQTYITNYVQTAPPGTRPQRAVICIDLEQGEEFIAYFCHINQMMCQYIDEHANPVDIMMAEPERIEFINRIA